MTIHYLQGDATQPQGDGPKVIAHICNNDGKWGAGFSGALSRRWPEMEVIYREWYRRFSPVTTPREMLGHVVFAYSGTERQIVAHMIAQDGTGRHNYPLRYGALKECLLKVNHHIDQLELEEAADQKEYQPWTIHMPRIGCGLAGGHWAAVEPLIQSTLVAGCHEVYVYDLPQERPWPTT